MGLGLARTVRRQQAQTLAFIDAVLRIRHELQYRLTPLPDVFLALQESREAAVAAWANTTWTGICRRWIWRSGVCVRRPDSCRAAQRPAARRM